MGCDSNLVCWEKRRRDESIQCGGRSGKRAKELVGLQQMRMNESVLLSLFRLPILWLSRLAREPACLPDGEKSGSDVLHCKWSALRSRVGHS